MWGFCGVEGKGLVEVNTVVGEDATCLENIR